MDFPNKLAALRKEQAMSQQTLADLIGVHVIQVSRYETGTSQPTLDVIRKMALALHVSANELLFDQQERGPDSHLRLQFEAISQFSDDDKKVVSALLEALILRHQAQVWAKISASSVNASSSSSQANKPTKTSKASHSSPSKKITKPSKSKSS